MEPENRDASGVAVAAPISPSGPTDPGILGLGERVCRYFLDFLETDFKRQQAPRRRVQGRTESGQPTSINLRKYRKFCDEVWSRFARPLKESSTFTVGRSAYTAQLNPILQDLIRKHVSAIEDRLFEEAIAIGIEQAEKGRSGAPTDIEKYVDSVLDAIGTALDQRVVAPLLALLDDAIKKQAYSAIDSIYEIESDLVEALLRQVDEQLGSTLTSFVVNGDKAPLEAMLKECLSPLDGRERLTQYIESIATSDLFQDVRDLHTFFRMQETASFYLYVCDLRYQSNLYPIMYVPMQVEFEKEAGRFIFSLDPHLYVNKRAIDYVLRDIGDKLGRLFLTPIEERILYLDEGSSLINELERIINRVQGVLDLDASVNIKDPKLQSASSSTVRLSTSLHLAVFDKSDESLLNDYEALLSAMHTDEQQVSSLFQRFVGSCILDNPVRVIEPVEEQWNEHPIPERLVAKSPIPLNEEQRKLLLALKDSRTQFAVVHGPPGSGKSHTITAIAFDCILEGQNVLILSDKQEALDVVQDKLTSTLQKVRVTDDFLNPILRLGRSHGTYAKLLSPSALERIRQHYRAGRANAKKLKDEIDSRDRNLKAEIAKTVSLLSSVSLADVEEFHRLEIEIEKIQPGLAVKLGGKDVGAIASDLLKASGRALSDASLPAAEELLREEFKGRSISDLAFLLKVRTFLFRAGKFRERAPLQLFKGLNPAKTDTLGSFLSEYLALRMPIFRFLFRGARLEDLNRRFLEALPCEVRVAPHKHLAAFAKVFSALDGLEKLMVELQLPILAGPLCYDELREGRVKGVEFGELLSAVLASLRLSEKLLDPEGVAVLDLKAFGSFEAFLRFFGKLARYQILWERTRSTLERVPKFDAVASRATLEALYTQKMADEIDRRFIEFVDGAYSTAKSLATVIRGKKQFQTDDFAHLKSAFPCTIAGIREFAEYIPLRSDMFDVVIIDEASQVSVAQAFPALLRAKKVVVFGDAKQFSNVKSANASNQLNEAYLKDIRGFFEGSVSKSAEKLARLSRFDVKRSILEFFDLVANYEIMLRKHFRGYQELISFSSHYFYGDSLQAIKIRGKPLDEVIQFTELEPSNQETTGGYRNVNTAECEFLRIELDELLREEFQPSVGIITPFREQQQYLTRELFRGANADRYESKLRLKIMTFDTCQGEERDLIFYSMVASMAHDGLNYIFPVHLVDTMDRIEEKLKMQRLNVGFSRAKESIHFILSKPIDTFHGSIARVLQHYKAVLERDDPSEDEVDPNSPMERKVLDWVLKSPFYQRHGPQVELLPQFPLGNYLKQLDPFYVHPSYRVDFLLRYRSTEGELFNIVIEYDGFQEHFVEHQKIHEGNWESYYRPEDVERQMILESYGYKFLRINRFNMGENPPDTLSGRLYDLIEIAGKEEQSGVIDRIQEQVEGQQDGSWKVCTKCHELKGIDDFFDQALKKGAGGHGRICVACKQGARSDREGAKTSGRSYRQWSKRRRWR